MPVPCPMNSSLRLRQMTAADLPFADSVRALAGWNQTLGDWQRMLAHEPEGCFLAEWNGAPAGTATTTVYGQELAWIGMVLVHPDYRRRGVGKGLLERCIEYLRGRGVRCIKLDATPLGQKVYDRLGFKNEWTLSRWVHTSLHPGFAVSDPRIRSWRVEDCRLIDRLDTAAFGVSRQRLLQALAQQNRHALVLESEPRRVAAYGLRRSGAQALYLGPVVATSATTGLRLVEALLARTDGETIFWDIPDPNAAAVAWASRQGFSRQRSLTRMYLGRNSAPGDPRKQFALAGPEKG